MKLLKQAFVLSSLFIKGSSLANSLAAAFRSSYWSPSGPVGQIELIFKLKERLDGAMLR